MARFIEYRYPKWRDGFDLNIIRRMLKRQAGEVGSGASLPGKAGFIVESFCRSGFDKETGEVLKDAWDAEYEIARIRQALDSKRCFITHMLEEQTGAFWDETVYSPRDTKDGKNLSMPLKQAGTEGYLDPRTYGGPNNVRQAYFFLFAAKDKKGRTKYFFEGVPIYRAQAIKADASGAALRAYAQEIATANGCADVTILREKVLFGQRIRLGDTELMIRGRSNGRNWALPVREMVFSWEELQAILSAPAGTSRGGAFEKIISTIELTCPRLAAMLNLREYFEKALDLETDQWGKLIWGIIQIASGSQQKINLKCLGGAENAGMMALAVAKFIPDITWIDQSVTGIFEKRTTFEELTRGL
jgi:CRISPR-associated endonuclease Csn1